MLLQSLAYAGTLAIGLKYFLGRKRPFTSNDQYSFNGFQTNENYQSFPSAHCVVAFATSTILAERINTWWSRVVFYGFATLTAYARVHNNQHWFSDVIFGGLIGFGSSWFVLNREAERKSNSDKEKKGGGRISIYPSFNGLGIVLRL